jgi:hypothetical protein
MTTTRLLALAVMPAGAFAANYVIGGAVAAAQPIPIPARFGRTPPATSITHTGSPPWWVFVLVAALASALTIAANITVARLRHSRRPPAARASAGRQVSPSSSGNASLTE